MSDKITKLIEYLAKLPGIGPRQASRLVLSLTQWREEELDELSRLISDIKSGVTFCKQCFNFTDNELCKICSHPRRNQHKIAVVEKPTDIQAIEKTAAFDGVYHVLGSLFQPNNGENIRVTKLIDRVSLLKAANGLPVPQTRQTGKTPDEIEIIIATNPSTYGQATELMLREKLTPLNIKTTRLAQGLSAGSVVEYSDEITLANAIKYRR